MHTFVRPLLLRVLEGVPDDPVHAFVGIDLFLDRDLVVRVRLEAAADADVDAFGVLAEHHEVHVVRAAALERTQPLVEQLHRTVVDVEVQLEASAEEDLARVPVVGHARIAERADQDGVELPQQVVAVRRQRLAGRDVVVGAPGQVLELERPAELLSTACRTLTASAVTSLPMPSPAMTAIRMIQTPSPSPSRR